MQHIEQVVLAANTQKIFSWKAWPKNDQGVRKVRHIRIWMAGASHAIGAWMEQLVHSNPVTGAHGAKTKFKQKLQHEHHSNPLLAKKRCQLRDSIVIKLDALDFGEVAGLEKTIAFF